MVNQKSSQGLITSYLVVRGASSNSPLPHATIVEAPRAGGPSIHHIPTSTELAHQQASVPYVPARYLDTNLIKHHLRVPAPVPAPALRGEADVDPEEHEEQDLPEFDSDNEGIEDEQVSRTRVGDLPEELRPVALTTFELYRVFIATQAAFPYPVQHATYCQESLS